MPATPIATCDLCQQSTATALLTDIPRALGRRPQRTCLNCRLDADFRTDRMLFCAFTAPSLLILPLLFPLSSDIYTTFSLACLVAVSLMFLTVVPIHEGAHALAALLVGYRVAAIDIGHGHTLFVLNSRFFQLRINAVPTSGLCHCYPQGNGARIRSFLFVAAGPLATGSSIVIWPMLIYHFSTWLPEVSRQTVTTVLCFIMIAGNACYLVVSLRPSRKRASDGQTLFRLICHPTKPENVVSKESAEALRALEQNDLAAARASAQSAFQRHPASTVATSVYLATLAIENQWHNIQQLLRPLVGSPTFTNNYRFYLLVANLHTRTPEDLAESAQLLAASRNRYSIHNAFLPMVQGNPADALKLLSFLALRFNTPKDSAVLNLALAHFHEQCHCPAQADRYRARAAKLPIPLQQITPLIPTFPEQPATPKITSNN